MGFLGRCMSVTVRGRPRLRMINARRQTALESLAGMQDGIVSAGFQIAAGDVFRPAAAKTQLKLDARCWMLVY